MNKIFFFFQFIFEVNIQSNELHYGIYTHTSTHTHMHNPTHRDGTDRERTIADKVVEKEEHSFTLDDKADWCNHSGNQFVE